MHGGEVERVSQSARLNALSEMAASGRNIQMSANTRPSTQRPSPARTPEECWQPLTRPSPDRARFARNPSPPLPKLQRSEELPRGRIPSVHPDDEIASIQFNRDDGSQSQPRQRPSSASVNSDSSGRSHARTEAGDSQSGFTIERMARALERARENKWSAPPDRNFRPTNPPAQGMPGLVERLGMPRPGEHAAQAPQASTHPQQSTGPAGAPQPQVASLPPQPQQQAPGLAPSLAPPPASSYAPPFVTPPPQPAIVTDHVQQLIQAQPLESQGAATGTDYESQRTLRPWMVPGFRVTTSELLATKDHTVDEYRDHKAHMGKPANIEMKKPEMKESLQANQQLFRNRGPWHHEYPDDGFETLSPLRLEPAPQIAPDVLFKEGLYYTSWNKTPPTTHVMTHLHGGIMIDTRAWIIAASISEETLPLEVFKPGTMSEPVGENQLRDMRDVHLAWFWYRTLRRRALPWDHSNEVLENFLIEADHFADTSRPVGGFYRMTSHPQHLAVATLIRACHRVLVGRTQDRPGILTIRDIEDIHRQTCCQSPDKWSPTPPPARVRGQRESSGPAAKRQKASDPGRAKKSSVKKAIIASQENLCVLWNIGEICTKPEAQNTTVKSCIMKRAGQQDRVLAHSCAFMVNGKRCGATDHGWIPFHL